MINMQLILIFLSICVRLIPVKERKKGLKRTSSDFQGVVKSTNCMVVMINKLRIFFTPNFKTTRCKNNH